MRRLLPLVLLFACGLWSAEPGAIRPEAIVETYAARNHDLREASMEVGIEARLPRLHKEGRLRAVRHISRLGRISYDILSFDGDGAIKSQVIARYISAETQAQKLSLAVTPANYKFKYKGLAAYDGRQVHLFEVRPRRKKAGLFRGDLWIDAHTYFPVRESGRMLKSPSFFLKSIDFVREYDIQDGVPVPKRLQSLIDTRLIGKAELTVDFSHVSFGEQTEIALAGDTE